MNYSTYAYTPYQWYNPFVNQVNFGNPYMNPYYNAYYNCMRIRLRRRA